MTTSYPARRSELQGLMVRLGRELPSPMGGFANLHKAAASKGTLDTKTKELIALGIAVAIRCDLASRFTFMMRSRRALAAPRCSRRSALPS